MTGGIAGLGGPGDLPEFSLYADGRAVVTPKDGDAVQGVALKEYRLKPEALRRLLDEARAAGLGRSQTLGSEQIADAMILEVTVGRFRTRVVQPESMNVPATRFWKRLDPAGWSSADQAAPARSYNAPRVAVLAGEATSPSGGRAAEWPLTALGKGEQAAGGLCTVFGGRDARTTKKLAATAKPDARWRSQGKLYSARFRPLLPDETTCQDVARA